MKYNDVTRTTHTSLDVLLEKNIDDYWNVDGESELFDTWTGFTRFILLNWFTWSGARQTRKNKNKRQDPTMYGRICKSMCLMQRKRKQNKNGPSRNQDRQCRQWREIFFIERNDEEFKVIWKSLGESVKIRCQQQCLVKPMKIAARKFASVLWKARPHMHDYRCRRIYEKTIGRCAAQVSRSSQRCKRNKFTELIQFGINSRCKGGSGGKMANIRENPGICSWRKSETRKRWSMKQGIREEKFILHHWRICVIRRIRSWNFIVKDDSGSYAVFTEKGSSQSQMTPGKVMDFRMFRTGSWCSIFLNSGWEKVLKLGMFVCQPSKRIVLISVFGRYEIGGEEAEH